jgi:hypothetical protein
VKTLKDAMSSTEINQFRFRVMRGLARGSISSKQAKAILGVQTAINQSATYVGNEDKEYVRVEGLVSSLAH